MTDGFAGSARRSTSLISTASGKSPAEREEAWLKCFRAEGPQRRRREGRRDVVLKQGAAASVPPPLPLCSVTVGAAPHPGPSPRTRPNRCLISLTSSIPTNVKLF